MMTHQESKIGGRVPWSSVQQFSVHSPTVDSVYIFTNHNICIYTSIISVIYEQKRNNCTQIRRKHSEKSIA